MSDLESVLKMLPTSYKMMTSVENLKYENECYKIYISYLKKKIEEEESLDFKGDTYYQEMKGVNVKELELKILQYQIKIKLNKIKIAREQINIKNYKYF